LAAPTSRPGTLNQAAPGKLTLSLRVTGRRPDGYHTLDITACFIALADTLTVDRGSGRLTVEGPFAAALTERDNADNLILRAARALAGRLGRPIDVDIHLTKRLPVAAGLGGGSADAAACLRALMAWWQVPADTVDLPALALSLGADVPMCLESRAVRAEGVGERLTPIAPAAFAGRPLVLANPGVVLATPAVFAALRAQDAAFSTRADDPGDPAGWRNDLLPAAVRLAPVVDTAIAMLKAQDGASFVSLAGSGPTCFALMDSEDQAARAAEAIARSQPDWWVRADRLTG
jgi:4-diphosphocytidyl-2-C-methyl-D-erythritol kinase